MTVIQSILAFTLAAGLLTLTPGLDTALVLRTAAVEGARPAMRAGLGISAGVMVWGLIASVGLGALLAVSTLAYDLLRAAGALYLLYLGSRMILRSLRDSEAAGYADAAPPRRSPASDWFVRGLLTNLLNPKVGVFYITLMPQFIPPGASVIGLSVLFAAIHASQGAIWFLLLTRATARLGGWIARTTVKRWLDRLTGGVLILFGAKLALDYDS